MIMEGNVFVDNEREDKAGAMFDTKAKIELKGNTLKYVSRGGLKLEKAMKQFDIALAGAVCMDIGASTEALPTVCCKTARRRSMPSMSATDNLHGN